MSHVFCVANQKGGVGKTTTTVNLAAALAKKGKKVLLIDLDAQGNATMGSGIEKSERSQTIYELLIGTAKFEDVLVRSEQGKYDVLPSNRDFAAAELDLAECDDPDMRLKKILESVADRYDYVLIDCPPSLGLLTINALTAADSVLIPIQCEYYALEGVTKLLESMKMVKSRLNKGLDTYGVLMTMYDSRTSLSNQVVEEVQSYFGDKAFKTLIPRTVKISEAPSFGEPVITYAPQNKGAKAYMNLAKEVIKRA